jgi:hypothetical protein
MDPFECLSYSEDGFRSGVQSLNLSIGVGTSFASRVGTFYFSITSSVRRLWMRGEVGTGKGLGKTDGGTRGEEDLGTEGDCLFEDMRISESVHEVLLPLLPLVSTYSS